MIVFNSYAKYTDAPVHTDTSVVTIHTQSTFNDNQLKKEQQITYKLNNSTAATATQ